MRAFGGIVAGLAIGIFVTIVVGALAVGSLAGGAVGRSGVDPSNSRQILDMFSALPTTAKLGFIFAWFCGTLGGASVAKLISRTSWVAWLVTGLITLYVLLNAIILAMPGWMQFVAVVAPLLGGLIANHLVKSRAPAPLPVAEEVPAGADL